MTSLYQALKSAARVVRALLSATQTIRDHVGYSGLGYRLLTSAHEIPEHHLSSVTFVRPNHNRKSSVSGIGEFELLAEGLRAEGVLDPETSISQLVSQGKHVRQIRFADEPKKHVDADFACRDQPFFLQQLAQHDVSHAEPESRKLYSAELPKEVVVSTAATDRTKCSARVEE